MGWSIIRSVCYTTGRDAEQRQCPIAGSQRARKTLYTTTVSNYSPLSKLVDNLQLRRRGSMTPSMQDPTLDDLSGSRSFVTA